MPKSNDYSLSLHWKQGDDFSACIDKSRGVIEQALTTWANGMRENAMHLERLATLFHYNEDRLVILGDSAAQAYEKTDKPVDVIVSADTHHIGFYAHTPQGEQFLQMLAKEGLIHTEEMEDEDSEEEESN